MSTAETKLGINDLADYLSSTAIISLKNPTPFNIYIHDGGLYTADFIPKDTVIGDIVGDPAYIWEIRHNEYIVVDDEFVLDVHRHKSNMLSHVREENLTRNLSNSFVYMQIGSNGETTFKLVTKTAIMPNHEIVYSAFDFINADAHET